MNPHVANHLLLTKLIPQYSNPKFSMQEICQNVCTASKRRERAPSTENTYNMLNMPIFGNICSFLSVRFATGLPYLYEANLRHRSKFPHV